MSAALRLCADDWLDGFALDLWDAEARERIERLQSSIPIADASCRPPTTELSQIQRTRCTRSRRHSPTPWLSYHVPTPHSSLPTRVAPSPDPPQGDRPARLGLAGSRPPHGPRRSSQNAHGTGVAADGHPTELIGEDDSASCPATDLHRLRSESRLTPSPSARLCWSASALLRRVRKGNNERTTTRRLVRRS